MVIIITTIDVLVLGWIVYMWRNKFKNQRKFSIHKMQYSFFGRMFEHPYDYVTSMFILLPFLKLLHHLQNNHLSDFHELVAPHK